MNDLLLTYYGDDFTGSTDVMESLTIGGVPTVLFLGNPPSPETLHERFPHAKAMGVAGISRSMTPAQMDEELPPKFKALKQFGAPLFHYKICSTFDSSPTVGSIGHATEIGFRVFESPFVPVVVGAPVLRRYVAFGNLFAFFGGQRYRIDRHPTMSKHPITPMDEADLRLHLGKQTTRQIGLIDYVDLEGSEAEIDAHFQECINNGAEVILFDTLNDENLFKIGRVIWGQKSNKPVFIVSSSGVEYALSFYWQSIGMIQKPPPPPSPGPTDQLVIMSGSCAPQTGAQIEWALQHDFVGLRLNAPRLVDNDAADAEREAIVAQTLEIIERGQSVVLYSAQGSDDPAITTTNRQLESLGVDPKSVSHRLGKQQGLILRTLLEKSKVKRACVAGGDTCGHTALQLGIYALEMIVPIAPGAPLCRAFSPEDRFNGLEISLKGGQNGNDDYFGCIRQGSAIAE